LFAEPLEVVNVFFITSDFHVERVNAISNKLNEKVFNNYFNIKIISCAHKPRNIEREFREKKALQFF
jgi:hypothetical protein